MIKIPNVCTKFRPQIKTVREKDLSGCDRRMNENVQIGVIVKNAMGQRSSEIAKPLDLKRPGPRVDIKRIHVAERPMCHTIRREGEGASPKSEHRQAPPTPGGDGMRCTSGVPAVAREARWAHAVSRHWATTFSTRHNGPPSRGCIYIYIYMTNISHHRFAHSTYASTRSHQCDESNCRRSTAVGGSQLQGPSPRREYQVQCPVARARASARPALGTQIGQIWGPIRRQWGPRSARARACARMRAQGFQDKVVTALCRIS